ncbi:DUF305 domain-containing protein [Actinoallomurus rhizosphaericola]|uniref:DUF305 domain-containing protein n=1 Tax=Actinoallomurus rhizosphaericola TaxID=2952536 RepID=UPI002092C145|nr:DUF305 domain-containing protein [Actinoallomurus rhizosphaericola]MCO5995987.1 DUF305 domain-containing protein [Actinoallomurus rhizosphaericola]
MKRALSLVVVPVAALTLAACGGGTDDSAHPMNGHSMSPGMSMGSAPATAGHNAQDVMFAQMMIPHHRQAITMARQAATKASSPEVKRLAAQIENAQQPEIDEMTGWLKDWGASTPSPGGMHMGEGMMSDQDMKKLDSLSGSAFDKAFLELMIQHHQGAVAMAGTEQAKGSNADAKALAASIIRSQSAEIATMRNLLKQR